MKIYKVTERRYPFGPGHRVEKNVDYEFSISLLPYLLFSKSSMGNTTLYGLSVKWLIWSTWITLYKIDRESVIVETHYPNEPVEIVTHS